MGFRRFHRLVLLVTLILASSPHAHALTVTVDHVEDDVGGTCDDAVANDCSLRGALIAANARVEPTRIEVPAGYYHLTGNGPCTWRTTRFGSSTDAAAMPLCFAGPITLVGAGAGVTVIDANQRDRGALVGNDAPIEIRGVTIRKGAQRNGSSAGGGGGINTAGTLTLVDVDITDSFGDAGGGAIYNSGILRLQRTRLLRNVAPGTSEGGGLYNDNAAASIADSEIANNLGGVNGGGIFNFIGTLEVSGTAIHDNDAGGFGGGIGNFGGNRIGVVRVVNSTISGNAARGAYGGGIYNGQLCTLEIRSTTITDNRAGTAPGTAYGGGVANISDSTITVGNSVIAGNHVTGAGGAPDCYGYPSVLQSLGHNLFQDVSQCGRSGATATDVIGVAPLLAALADNGGFAPTHALTEGSPAIDGGDRAMPGSGGSACPITDQRGVLRPLGTACDMGAFEHAAALALGGVKPARGGDTGTVTAVLTGSGFATPALVRLVRSGQSDVLGSPVAVDSGGASLTTRFDLTGRVTGAWDVAVTVDDVTTTLPGAFRVEAGSAPALWIDLVGRNRIRPGRVATYLLAYGNRGNVDALAAPLALNVAGGYALTGLFTITPPPAQVGQIATDWDAVPVSVFVGTRGDVANVPLLLPIVPAGFSGILRFTLTVPPDASDDEVLVALGKPWLEPQLDPTVIETAVAGAQAYAERNLATSLPALLVPQLTAYATSQVALAVANGRDVFVASADRDPAVYSVAQLEIDLARYGKSLADALTADAGLGWRARGGRLLARVLGSLAPGQVLAEPCSGGAMIPGSTCTPNERPMPPPDKPGDQPPLTPAQCRDIHNHSVSSDGKWCVPTDKKKCGLIQNPIYTDPDCLRLPVGPKNSLDPNDKVGTRGGDTRGFVGGALPLSYTVFFENLETATAPAQEVIITDPLDVVHVDVTTLALGPITFGAIVLQPPPGVSSFSGAVDFRPAQPLLVKVEAGVDVASGVLTWRFTAVDPETGQLTDDPDLGFLPPNVTPPEGDGSVSFTIAPRAGLTTGTAISNSAAIVFDINDAIATPTWTNVIDKDAPASAVTAARAVGCAGDVLVRWAGTDTGAGVATFDVLVSDDGAPATLWREATVATDGSYPALLGHTYAFTSVAVDGVGNREPVPLLPDITITAASCTTLSTTSTTTTLPPSSSTTTTLGPAATTTTTLLLVTTTTQPPCTTPRCVLRAAFREGSCAGAPVPAAIIRKVDHGLAAIDAASTQYEKQAKRTRKRAARFLKAAGNLAAQAGRGNRPKLVPDCANRIREATNQVQRALGR